MNHIKKLQANIQLKRYIINHRKQSTNVFTARPFMVAVKKANGRWQQLYAEQHHLPWWSWLQVTEACLSVPDCSGNSIWAWTTCWSHADIRITRKARCCIFFPSIRLPYFPKGNKVWYCLPTEQPTLRSLLSQSPAHKVIEGTPNPTTLPSTSFPSPLLHPRTQIPTGTIRVADMETFQRGDS